MKARKKLKNKRGKLQNPDAKFRKTGRKVENFKRKNKSEGKEKIFKKETAEKRIEIRKQFDKYSQLDPNLLFKYDKKLVIIYIFYII